MTVDSSRAVFGRRRAPVRADALVQMGALPGCDTFPLSLTPAADGLDLVEWAATHRALIDSLLDRHGALLLRGFDLATPQRFADAFRAACGEALEYHERSSPRTHVEARMYTSTEHPPSQAIFPHNEQSYNVSFPLRIAFFCAHPADTGGETPIVDCRRVYQQIDAGVRRRFLEQGYCYVRHFGRGLGLSWQECFQTSDRAAVEAYCRAHQIDWTWTADDGLRTAQRRPVAARHPRTGEISWCNHATFFHVSTLPAELAAQLTAALGEDALPHQTYFGDNAPIPAEVTEHLRAAYQANLCTFTWQAGDVLLLDNLLTAHARAPFTGPRQVLVGMARPCRWDAVAMTAEGADRRE